MSKPNRTDHSENAGSREPAKISQLITDFAAPVLAIARTHDGSFNAIRDGIRLATLCWNAPARLDKDDESAMDDLEKIAPALHPTIQEAVRLMLHERVTRYRALTFEVLADLERQPGGVAQVSAYAGSSREELGALQWSPESSYVDPKQLRPFAAREADSGKKKMGANQQCPCGSGRKYKRCCRS